MSSKVLVFFNSQPVRAIEVNDNDKTVECEYPNGEKATLNIMHAGVHSLTGDHLEIRVATDRELSSDDIMTAARKFI